MNKNHFRPCPTLENPAALRKLIKETGAVNTDYESPEEVDQLCARCDSYAANWTPAAPSPAPSTSSPRILPWGRPLSGEPGILPYLRPDGKAQVTVAYEDRLPKWADTIVVSAQHDPDADIVQFRSDLEQYLIRAVIPHYLLREQTRIYIDPTGRFVLGGPAADSGLTGRKIIADTYLTFAPQL